MLQTLTIKNVALIKELAVDFTEGLNILSGETGAGKSILIDSLNFVLGGKSDRQMIRAGEEKCSAEAVFSLPDDSPALDLLEEIGAERENTLILSRTMDVSGKGRASVNGKTVTAAMLRSFTERLSDIHGQSEHHSLMRVATHIDLLDRFAGEPVERLLAETAEKYERYCGIQKRLSVFGGSDEERERAMDLCRYQIEEIENAGLVPGEEEELKAARVKAVNAERILEALNQAAALLKDADGASLDTLGAALGELQRVSDFDADIEAQRARLESLKYDLEDVAETLGDVADNADFDEAELDRIERRIEELKGLHRKYGKDVPEMLAFLEKARLEYDRYANSGAEIERLKKEKSAVSRELYESSKKLSAARREAAKRLEAGIMAELEDLGLKNAVFRVVFSEMPEESEAAAVMTAGGFDKAEFFLTANLGQPPAPLVKVISGGEASRFMLAVKTITSEIDAIPLLVFDEIDTGISGEIAQMVAKKFAAIARRHQLVAITHLPQIAAMGDSNFLIEKRASDGETVTGVRRLSPEEKEIEVARLAGGSNIGEHGVLHARELIAWCEAYKDTL